MENEIIYINLNDIIPNRFQPREIFDEKSLNELADSIKQHGVIEPIIVRPVSNKYEIIAGERRYKASAIAGLTTIPCIVRDMDDKESSLVAYIENEQRKDVSVIEKARTADRILKNNNMTQEQLAKSLGISQSTLANRLRLLDLPVEIQESLMRNEISERHARSLLSVDDVATQINLLNKVKENKMTVRELESEIKNMNNGFQPMDNFNNGNYGNVSNDYSYNQQNNGNSSIPSNENNNFMNFLNNYDTNNPEPAENTVQESIPENNNFMNFLNNYDTTNPEPVENTVQEPMTTNNVVINNVNPPITSNFTANSYVEDNPAFVDISKNVVINNVDQIIDELKETINKIKTESKFKIDTDEINFDDIYQITIKIDKRDF